VAVLGPGALNTTIAVGIWGVPAVTRIVRGSVLALRETEYVGAARALGSPAAALLRRHILPNIVPGLIVYATLFMANAILLEAALSFLGLGVQPPTASWGLMVSTGRDVLLVAPHVATVPGLAIMLAVLAFNLVGDGLRDALDPRLRGSAWAPRRILPPRPGNREAPMLTRRGGTLIDGTGRPPVRDATIVIEEGRVGTVTTGAAATWPASAEVVDVAG